MTPGHLFFDGKKAYPVQENLSLLGLVKYMESFPFITKEITGANIPGFEHLGVPLYE